MTTETHGPIANPRYRAWLTATGGGRNYEFTAWIAQQVQAFAKERPDAVTFGGITNHDAFDAFLEREAQIARVGRMERGQRGTYSGYPATFIRHYGDGAMIEISVPGGVTCVNASEFITE